MLSRSWTAAFQNWLRRSSRRQRNSRSHERCPGRDSGYVLPSSALVLEDRLLLDGVLTVFDFPGAAVTMPQATSGALTVGTSSPAGGEGFGFVYDRTTGVKTTLVPPGALRSAAVGVSGTSVVGVYGTETGFLYDVVTGVYTPLSFTPTAIDGSTIVGTRFDDVAFETHGVVSRAGVVTLIDLCDGDTRITGVSGTAFVGYIAPVRGEPVRGFVSDGVDFTMLSRGSHDVIMANGIHGTTVVGEYGDRDSSRMGGFAYDTVTGDYTNVSFPGYGWTAPAGVYANNIVGTYKTPEVTGPEISETPQFAFIFDGAHYRKIDPRLPGSSGAGATAVSDTHIAGFSIHDGGATLTGFLYPLGADVIVDSLTFRNDTAGGADVAYTVTEPFKPERIRGDAVLSLFWSPTPDASDPRRLRATAANAAPIVLDLTAGEHSRFIAQSQLVPPPSGAQFLVAAFDVEQVIDEALGTNNDANAPLVDLVARANSDGAFDYFKWNPAEDSSEQPLGGFSFAYEVKAPAGISHVDFRDTVIEFYWATGPRRSDIIDGELAFSLALDEAAALPAGVAIPEAERDLKGLGIHHVMVPHGALLAGHRSPVIEAGATGEMIATHLVMVIDHPRDADADAGLVYELEPAELGADNNVTGVKVAPLVVTVLTHGWDSGRDAWLPYEALLEEIPVPDSMFDGRVQAVAMDWDSDGTRSNRLGPFDLSVTFLALSKLFKALQPPGSPVDDLLLEIAAHFAAKSGAKARAAAADITADIEDLLLPLDESNRIQTVHLIGHSRGGAVSAEVSRLLKNDNYNNVGQLTVLDAYSTDWPDDGGIVGDFPVEAAIAGRRVSYMVEAGLAAATPFILGLSAQTPLTDLIASFLVPLFGDLKAPVRPGFENTIIATPASDHVPTHHINITDRYMQSALVYDFETGISTNLSYPPDEQFVLDNLVGWNRFVGSALQNVALQEGDFVHDNAVIDPAGGSQGGTNAIRDRVESSTGFSDGTFATIGRLAAALADLDVSSTGDAFLDYWLHRLSESTFVTDTLLRTSGSVSVVSTEGAEAQRSALAAASSDSTSLRLVQTADTSLTQFVYLPEHAEAITFDLFVESASAGDTLDVFFGNVQLTRITLSSVSSFEKCVIDLSQSGARAGDVTFRLSGPVDNPAAIRLDNLGVSVLPNHAPTLNDRNLSLPIVAHDSGTSQNPGTAVSDLLAGFEDLDEGDVPGLVVIGTNEVAGTVQYSLDDGATWIDVGAVSDSDALLLSGKAGTRLRLLPAGEFTGDVPNLITFRDWDGSNGITGLSGERYDASEFGASTPFSAETDTVAILVLAVTDTTAPISSVDGLPSITDTPTFTVTWSGVDEDGGSGIAAYDVYVSEDFGEYAPLATGTSATSAQFTGRYGHSYSFYSVAIDRSGNREATPSSSQADTSLFWDDFTPPTSSVAPLPITVSANDFLVTWSGTDNDGGSGITAFDILVSDNGSDFEYFLYGTTDTSAVFSGAAGHTYAFYSVAFDAAGNVEAPPAEPDTATTVVLDTTAPTSSLSPLPATQSTTTFPVSWAGTDNEGGSGLATFSVYVSDNGGEFVPLATNTTNTSTLFTGQFGHTYAFYSIATDNAGNVEAVPGAPDATTLVLPATAGFTIQAISPVSPDPRATAVASINVSFTAPIDISTLSAADLSLTLDGGTNLLGDATLPFPITVSLVSGSTYKINGLAPYTNVSGTYHLTIAAAGIQDSGGSSGDGSAATSWTLNTAVPKVAFITPVSPNTRETPVDAIDVTFSKPIALSSFTTADLSLKLNGGPNLLTGAETISSIGSPYGTGTTYRIAGVAGLTNLDGKYTFTVNAAGVTDVVSGVAGSGAASTTWTLKRVPPKVSAFAPISPNPTNVPLDTLSVTFSEPIDPATFDLADLALKRGSTVVPFTGTEKLTQMGETTWEISGLAGLTNLDGKYTLTVRTVGLTDAFGIAGTTFKSVSWTEDFTAPTVASFSKLGTARNTSVDFIDIKFSEKLDLATLDLSDLLLTRNGGPNLLTGSVSIAYVSGSTYRLSGLIGLTAEQGQYVLTADPAGVKDPAGNTGAGSKTLSWTLDMLAPTSSVGALPATAASLSIGLSINGTEPVPSNGATPAGIKSYDLYVSIDGGAFALWKNVKAATTSAVTKVTYKAESNHTYAFYSLARDNAGNVEGKSPLIEASIAVPDLSPPVTEVVGVDTSLSTFTVSMQGKDVGTSGVASFTLYVSVDGAKAKLVGTVAAGAPDADGVATATAQFRAISDGNEHTYRFYSVGTDKGNKKEATPAVPADLEVTTTIAPQAIASFAVQPGEQQRSLVNSLDLLFSKPDDVAAIVASVNDGVKGNDALSFKRYSLTGAGFGATGAPAAVSLVGKVANNGGHIAVDFGAAGLTTDGYYELGIDLDGNGSIETLLHFYRLQGDFNGDRKVDGVDQALLAAALGTSGFFDLTGDGIVDAKDQLKISGSKGLLGHQLGAGLPVDA